MIPKIIHYCWFGGKPLPASTLRYMESWRKHCPDYEIRRWDESNFDVNCCDYVREAYANRRWAFVSDVARVWVLKNYGGVYFDTDVELIMPLEPLVQKYSGFTAFESVYQIGMGILACEKGSELFSEFYDIYSHGHFVMPDGTQNTDVIGRRFKNLCLKYGFQANNTLQTIKDITILTKDYFYPHDPVTSVECFTENTYTIHYYDASWISPVDVYGRTQQHKFRFVPLRYRAGFTRMVGMLKYEGLFFTVKTLLGKL